MQVLLDILGEVYALGEGKACRGVSIVREVLTSRRCIAEGKAFCWAAVLDEVNKMGHNALARDEAANVVLASAEGTEGHGDDSQL